MTGIFKTMNKNRSNRTLAKDILDFATGKMSSRSHELKEELKRLHEIIGRKKEFIDKHINKDDEK